MRVAILTMFNGLSSTYSLVNVVAEHIKMLLNAGISTKMLVSEDCPNSGRQGIFADERLEWVKVTNRYNGKQIEWHDYDQPNGNLHETFFDEADVIAKDIEIHLADVDVCMMHDIPTPGGKANWRPNTVESILTNEKYKGDALLQKKFTVDFLSKRTKVNEGEVPQYYVEGSHPAIITPELFDAVQAELKRRKEPGRRNYTPHCFSGYIYCDECGALYGSKIWNANSQYRSVVWQCNAKFRGHTACQTPTLRSEELQSAFVRVINQVIDNKAEILRTCEAVLDECNNIQPLTAEYYALHAEAEIIAGHMQQHISINAHTVVDQVEFQRQYDDYETRFAATHQRIDSINEQREALIAKRARIQNYLATLNGQDLVTEFDEALWYGTVDQVRVTPDGELRFLMKGGTEIRIDL